MPPTDNSSTNVKLLLIGSSSVGKSSLLFRFSDEQWLPEDRASPTIGVDFKIHKMTVNGKRVKLSIWDTAGQERYGFHTMTPSYYRGAQGTILVYDVTNRESFDALPRWYSELETYVSRPMVKILVGNKVDKEFSRQVSTTEGQQFADRMSSLFIEASAKTSVGVKEAFEEVVAKILDTPELCAPVGDKGAKPKGNETMSAGPGMPGNTDLNAANIVDLNAAQSTQTGGGCWC